MIYQQNKLFTMGFFKKLFGSSKKEQPQQQQTKSTGSDSNIVNIGNENEKMNSGIEKAKLTLNYFKESLKKPKAGQVYFSVKVKFTDKGMAEHIWLVEPEFDTDGNLFGKVGNVPRDVKTISINQRIGVDESHISDWMIFENGVLIGGYTIRAIRDGLPKSQVASFDRSLGGILIDDGEDHYDLDRSTPEGAILSIEKAYSSKNLDEILKFKNFKREAMMMLDGRENMDEATLMKLSKPVSRALENEFISSFSETGFPDFNNVKRNFPLREKITDKHYIITEICRHPDGSRSQQRINTYLEDDGWVVMHPEN